MSLLTRGFYRVRGLVAVGAIILFSANGFAEQTSPIATSTFNEPDFVKWALTQGGLVVVLLVVGWSYRRDLVSLIRVTQDQLRQEREERRVLTDLVEKSAVALQRMSDAVGTCPLRRYGERE